VFSDPIAAVAERPCSVLKGNGAMCAQESLHRGEYEMTKFWLASAAAFALMTGVASAQITSDTTTSTQSTTTTAPPVGSYNAYQTQHSTDSNGNQIDKSQTYQSGPNGTKATSATQSTSEDGAQKTTTHEDRVISPAGASTTDKTTTTTEVH
jgi:hypothetical protein